MKPNTKGVTENSCHLGKGQKRYYKDNRHFQLEQFIILFENLTLRRLMSYIYGAPILDVSRSHKTTQHSR